MALHCPVGNVKAKDLLLWKSGGKLRAGFAVTFFLASGVFKAAVGQLKHLSMCKFSAAQPLAVLVDVKLLLGAYPYIRGNDNAIFVVGSIDLLD
jgi:hypothetical protein